MNKLPDAVERGVADGAEAENNGDLRNPALYLSLVVRGAFLIAGGQLRQNLLRPALDRESTCKIEMNSDCHFDSYWRSIKQGWLVLPMPDSVKRRRH